MSLLDEIKSNYAAFTSDWKTALSTRLASSVPDLMRFQASYIRLTALQAWRANIVDSQLSTGSAGFFIEAQNDALISHIQASIGSWRVALKALRSCIENVLLCLYYKDHHVELALWEVGKFRLPFNEAVKYFKSHPSLFQMPDNLIGLPLITAEYEKLSKAVHSSATDFRMTADGMGVSLWKTDKKHEGRWETHEKRTLEGLNLLLLVLFRERLTGTALKPVRQGLGFVIPAKKDASIRAKLGVTVLR
jgi:hypothetical protein